MSKHVHSVLAKISSDSVCALFEAAGAERPILKEIGRNKRARERREIWNALTGPARRDLQLFCTRLHRFTGDFARESLWRVCRRDANMRALFDGALDVTELSLAVLLRSPRDFLRADSIRQSLRLRDRRDHDRFLHLRPASGVIVDDGSLDRLASNIREICRSIDGAQRHVEIEHFTYFASDRDQEMDVETHHFAATVESGAEPGLEFQDTEFDYVISRPANVLTVDYCPHRGSLDVAGKSVGAGRNRLEVARSVAAIVGAADEPAPVRPREFNLEPFKARRELPIDGVDGLRSARVTMIGLSGPEDGAGRSYEYAGHNQSVWDRIDARAADLERMKVRCPCSRAADVAKGRKD